MLSPPSTTSSLRKIRRPSKSVTPGTISPNQNKNQYSPNQVKEGLKMEPEPLNNISPPKSEDHKLSSPTPTMCQPEVQQSTGTTKLEPPPKPPAEPKWGEEEMPEKALNTIFSFVCHTEGCLPFLIRAAKVCKRWNKVTKDLSLWTHCNLGDGAIKDKNKSDKKLEWILENKFPYVQVLDLSHWKNIVSTSTLKVISSKCPQITGLILTHCVKLTSEDVRLLPGLFPNLAKIDLSYVSVSILIFSHLIYLLRFTNGQTAKTKLI